ncbi:hypothetical protein HYW35_02280 [Candidatus Saccharibacteria bacterium]|nr:hypothetical protein [Candidatus Saccharibacteria bacterium]
MTGKIKKLILLTVLSLIPILIPASALAAVDCSQPNLSSKQAIQCGTQGASGSDQDPSAAGTNIDNTIAKFVNVFSVIIGVIAVVMIIVGGFRYITSAGNTEKLTQAKNTIMYAIIGLVVVALAQAISSFVLSKTTDCVKGKTSTGQKC